VLSFIYEVTNLKLTTIIFYNFLKSKKFKSLGDLLPSVNPEFILLRLL